MELAIILGQKCGHSETADSRDDEAASGRLASGRSSSVSSSVGGSPRDPNRLGDAGRDVDNDPQ